MKLNQMTKVFLGLFAGVILGFFTKMTNFTQIEFIGVFGGLYIRALKAIAPILVFMLVMNSLAHGKNESKVQTKGIVFVIIAYLVSSLATSVVAVIASFIWKVTIPGLNVGEVENQLQSFNDILFQLLNGIVTNPVEALANGNYLAILFWAIIAGVLLRLSSENTIKVLDDLTDVISNTVQIIIKFAPLGVMGLTFNAVYENGVAIFVDYGKLIFLLVGTMLFSILVVNPLIVFILIKKNPYPLVFKCILKSGINAFLTRSSAANIPINLELCEELKLNRDIYSITIPLGSTINMNGAAAVITIMTMATAWTLKLNVSMPLAFLMCIIGTLAAAGTAGTAGGSLMLIPLACSILNIPSDMAWHTVGVGNQIGVIQDSVETMVNSSGDVIMTSAVDMALQKNKK